jgi:hypothetical protein
VGLNTLEDRLSLGLPKQDAKYLPSESDHQTTCAACGCCFHVQGKLGFYPQCGMYNALQHTLDEIGILVEDVHAGQKSIQQAYVLVVSAVKSYGCVLEKPLCALGKNNTDSTSKTRKKHTACSEKSGFK